MQRASSNNGREEGPEGALLSVWLFLLSYLLNFCTAEEEFSIISLGTDSGIEDRDWESYKCVYGCYLGHEQMHVVLPAHMHMSKSRKAKCYWNAVGKSVFHYMRSHLTHFHSPFLKVTQFLLDY